MLTAKRSRDCHGAPDAATVALQALGWLLAEPARASRFLALTGLDPDELRTAIGDRSLHAAVMAFLAGHEADLLACADALGDRAVPAFGRGQGAFRMNRPLLITDCDEVLLHMVRHMSAWLDEAHAIDFWPAAGHFSQAARRRADGAVIEDGELWDLLGGFFATEMARQTLVPHADAALERIAAVADIVVLTNLGEACLTGRVEQLARFGIAHRVICNGTGPKGAPVARLIEEYRPSVAVFVDDLGLHHASVATAAPEVFRLHMIAEPDIASDVPPAPEAHARIDDWADAVGWILDRFDRRPLVGRTPMETDA